VRVAIIQQTTSLNIKIRGPYKIIDAKSSKFLYKGDSLNSTISTSRDGIFIAGKVFTTGSIIITADNNAPVFINSRRFKGNIKLVQNPNSTLTVINEIDLEDYVKGILYHEASHYWPYEALKAQAVASRTYALYQIQESGLREYDVTSDVYSQVYGGSASERYRTNKAVDETRAEVLKYQGKVFPAYFHATCGGHTENASVLWNIDIPPLRGVVCGFCKDSPHFYWHTVLTLKDLQDKLTDSGYNIKDIEDIVILDRDNSGRVINLMLKSALDKITISAKDLRNIIGPDVIRSTNFSLDIVNHDVVFKGVGWGHGVGLCQWGAYFMAKQGYNYKQILMYYYPGADISITVPH